MAAAEPDRWAVIDADRDADAVFGDVLTAALAVLPASPGPSVGALASEPSATAGRMDR
jgi:hypothetical protein